MKKLTLLAVLTAATFATPVFAASEARVEARGGIAWASGESEAFAGLGAGYDFDLGDSAFAGVDVGADKVLVNGARVLWSVGARGGVRVGDAGRAYVAGGVAFCCSSSAAYAGVGYQHKFGSNVYGKIEYRRSFGQFKTNFAGVGVGYAF